MFLAIFLFSSIVIKMVLCQIKINSTNSLALPERKYYFCGLSGKYKARVVGITWVDNTNSSDFRVITIRSDSFRLPYGSQNGIIFCNKSAPHLTNPQGSFNFELEVVGNSIDLEFLTSITYSGGAQDAFGFCILSLDVQRIENENK